MFFSYLNYNMWTSLRYFFDIKYVSNRFAPVVVEVVTFAWLDYQPIFGKWSLAPYPKREEAENQPYVIFDVFLLLSLLLLFVCLLFYFVFFFLNVENLV